MGTQGKALKGRLFFLYWKCQKLEKYEIIELLLISLKRAENLENVVLERVHI